MCLSHSIHNCSGLSCLSQDTCMIGRSVFETAIGTRGSVNCDQTLPTVRLSKGERLVRQTTIILHVALGGGALTSRFSFFTAEFNSVPLKRFFNKIIYFLSNLCLVFKIFAKKFLILQTLKSMQSHQD